MSSILKVDEIQDTGSNAIITSDGAGNITTSSGLNTAIANAGFITSGGITEVDMFGVNDLNINTFTDYTLTSSNTTRISGFGGTTFTKTGTGITIDTNGKVTFPSTGQYSLVFNAVFAVLSTTSVRYLSAQIRGTNDGGSTITDRAIAYNSVSSVDSNTDYVSASSNLIFTVSDTANDNVYFRAQSATSSSNIRLTGYDGSSMLGTTFQIIKLV